MKEEAQYSEAAEMATLGSMILSARAAEEVVGILQAEDFVRPIHQAVFRALKRLVAAQTPIDLVTLKKALAEAGDYGKPGSIVGPEYLSELDLHVPSASNSGVYAGIVLERSMLRSAALSAREILALATEGGEGALEAILHASTGFGQRLGRSGARIAEVDTKTLVDKVLHRKRGGGHKTFFQSLDEEYMKRHGGLPPGQMTLVQALSGKGKTTTKLSMVLPALARGERCVLGMFADVDAEELAYRAIRYLTSFAGSLDECKDEKDRKVVMEAADRVHAFNWSIYDSAQSHGANTIEGFRLWLMRDVDRHGPPSRVMMDYAQRIATSRREMMANEILRNQYVSEQVRLLAGEIKTAAFLVGCQVTEKGEKNDKRYTAKNATDWDENAAVRLIVHRGKEAGDPTKLLVEKNRYGADGVEVPLRFHAGKLVSMEGV